MVHVYVISFSFQCTQTQGKYRHKCESVNLYTGYASNEL